MRTKKLSRRDVLKGSPASVLGSVFVAPLEAQPAPTATQP